MATEALPLAPAVFRRHQRNALTAGGAGMALCALAAFITPNQFFRSYLWALCFFVGIALGSLVLVMLQFLTGGAWGLVIRRIAEAATRTLPLLFLLFLPIAAGFVIQVRPSGAGNSRPAISGLYIWADPAVVEADEALAFKARFYLNVPFFLIRAAICFAVWIGVMLLVNRWSLAQDRPGAGDSRGLRKISAAGLVIYGLTVTVMAIDWIMSLEPLWVSSIFGPLIGVGQVLTALSFIVIVLALVADRPPLAGVVNRPVFRDLGSLMLAFVMMWAYLAFSQLLLIWSGNLPSEIPYYLRRIQGGWQVFAFALVLLHFALPFVLLLMHDVKRQRRSLLQVAGLILAMRAVDLYWMIMPAHPGPDGLGVESFMPSWTDIVAPIGIGGLWLASFLGQLQRRALLPSYDPRLGDVVHHE
jgi:hypothetical protein